MAVIAGQPVVTKSGLSAYFIFFFCARNVISGNIAMNIHITLGPLLALIAGILILVMPRLLNFIVAIYFIAFGLIGLFGLGSMHIH
jgi:hypothetical protein